MPLEIFVAAVVAISVIGTPCLAIYINTRAYFEFIWTVPSPRGRGGDV
jgi:hypothetical protein